LQESAVNSAEFIFSENGAPLKLAALCGRIARVVQRPALPVGCIDRFIARSRRVAAAENVHNVQT